MCRNMRGLSGWRSCRPIWSNQILGHARRQDAWLVHSQDGSLLISGGTNATGYPIASTSTSLSAVTLSLKISSTARVHKKFTQLSKADLDQLVKSFRKAKPDSGIRYLVGFLRCHGIRVQKRRVYASVRRVDGIGRASAASSNAVNIKSPGHTESGILTATTNSFSGVL
ncbi:hypothetical protein R3P38DRAFT_3126081 [Favolaschia claudopus]|uniref:Uncharacterized protein n=2 Tax=Favolaschia claudopus TaxID=2862362 RepID=A0AAV9ZAD2_9AGAR